MTQQQRELHSFFLNSAQLRADTTWDDVYSIPKAISQPDGPSGSSANQNENEALITSKLFPSVSEIVTQVSGGSDLCLTATENVMEHMYDEVKRELSDLVEHEQEAEQKKKEEA